VLRSSITKMNSENGERERVRRLEKRVEEERWKRVAMGGSIIIIVCWESECYCYVKRDA